MNKLLAVLFLGLSLNATAELTDEGWYQEGTKDGCSSGNKNFKKDIKAYVEKPYYKAGYDDGFMQCKRDRDYTDSIVNDAVNNAVYGRGGWW
jgi:hypothetical protein